MNLSSKLQKLLLAVENTQSPNEEFTVLSEKSSLKLGAFGGTKPVTNLTCTNQTCAGNDGCKNNGSCIGNESCSNNDVCNSSCNRSCTN